MAERTTEERLSRIEALVEMLIKTCDRRDRWMMGILSVLTVGIILPWGARILGGM